jgi:hypothetical protein
MEFDLNSNWSRGWHTHLFEVFLFNQPIQGGSPKGPWRSLDAIHQEVAQDKS